MPRVPFDSLCLSAIVDELRATLIGGQLQSIRQPSPLELAFEIRKPGATHILLLSCDAGFARTHLTFKRPPTLPEPTSFCMVCRKWIEGARLEKVSQVGFDRILRFEFARAESSAGTVVAEFMGKHSNLLLLLPDGHIADAAKHVTNKISRVRTILPGRPYVAPPPQEGVRDPRKLDEQAVAELSAHLPSDSEAAEDHLMGHFAGFSPFLAREVIVRSTHSGLAEAWKAVFGANRQRTWSPVLLRDKDANPVGAYPIPIQQLGFADQNPRETLSLALDHYHSVAAIHDTVSTEREAALTAIDRATKSLRKQLMEADKGLQNASRAQEYREAGELLLASSWTVPEQASEVEVPDFYGEPNSLRKIALDPALTAAENAQRYFKLARKADHALVALAQRKEKLEADLYRLATHGAFIRDAKDVESIRPLMASLQADGILRRPSGPQAQVERDPIRERFDGHRIKVVHTAEGYDILVGESATANDHLTTRVAASNDYWFHVRSSTSAHVVIRTQNKPQSVPKNVIEQAALLAAKNSGSKHANMVPVDYTLRKFVRKPRGAAAGSVTYTNEKTVHVSPKGGN
jgi:predicted ribosome quality control (RQC) complex YloA/Tae2 family protein